MTKQELCQKARDMLPMAYVPYSHFPVGAALECEDGTVFTLSLIHISEPTRPY